MTDVCLDRADVVVVGGGHAGCEAALVAARSGCSTTLVTLRLAALGRMSCNPSIGGPGKAQLVAEIDALGGQMGRLADATALQVRWLNLRKGLAVRAIRAQSCKVSYERAMGATVAATSGLRVVEGEVASLLLEGGRACGVLLADGRRVLGTTVVLAAGTFLRGTLHAGSRSWAGGRVDEPASSTLSPFLASLGFPLGRLKTGTPPRILASSVDTTSLERQEGDQPRPRFSFLGGRGPDLPERPCFRLATVAATHDAVRRNLHRSPLHDGTITGSGPRYCPSIEAKLRMFPDTASHVLYLEPEGLDHPDFYLQGLSTSLPPEVQDEVVASIPGLRGARISRYGYAIEYDFIDPRQCLPTLETRLVPGLYLAGQILGTSGYEEAAAQGLLAGINAARHVLGLSPLVLARWQAYLGVMVDDLIRLGVTEPYRMFTSRAEHRLLLRMGTADARLTPLVEDQPHVTPERRAALRLRRDTIDREVARLRTTKVGPSPDLDAGLTALGSQPLSGTVALASLLRRPQVRWADLASLGLADPAMAADAAAEVECVLKYEGYVTKQERQVEALARLEDLPIPSDLSWGSLTGLSHEGREKLAEARPPSLGAASRVRGVRQADLSILLHHLTRRPSHDHDEEASPHAGEP